MVKCRKCNKVVNATYTLLTDVPFTCDKCYRAFEEPDSAECPDCENVGFWDDDMSTYYCDHCSMYFI